MSEYYEAQGCLKDKLAVQHIQALIKSWDTDKNWRARYFIYDMYHSRLCYLNGTFKITENKKYTSDIREEDPRL